MSGLNLRPSVLAAKESLAKGREKLMRQHRSGSPGIQVCALLTEVLDEVLIALYNAALAETDPANVAICREQLTLVPIGGYGRSDVAPFSDVDLLFLHEPAAEKRVAPLARRMMHDLYDVGLQLGHSVRTVNDACVMGRKDATIFTALAESRYLIGSQPLYDKFAGKFKHQAQRHWRSLVTSIEAARDEERRQFGETVYLLEPNVKKSRGGLRDIQLLRWIGFARFGEADPNSLQLTGHLSKADFLALRYALEFMLRLRNEMHFHCGKSVDVLTRDEQVRIAEVFGYKGTESLLPVEQFMSDYFKHSDQVTHIAARFTASMRPWRALAEWFAPLYTHNFEGDFRVGPQSINFTPRGKAQVPGDVNQVLRLCDLASLYNKSIAPSAWRAVNDAAPTLPDALPAAAAERFMSVLSQPARLGEILRGLHDCRVLEKIIPDFKHAHCLLQFNEYHKYTVDEHCIRAVERACAMAQEDSPLGRVYRNLKQKRTLHLALLIHDLGKGYIEDHSEVGLRIAEQVGQRLRLPARETETLKFLVHKHLTMGHLAFRRDTSDPQLIVRFAVEVGSPEVLQMLFLLTAADFAAVGPGVLNDWKVEVLDDLHQRTMRHLAGETALANTEEQRAAIRARLASEDRDDWYSRHLDVLPTSYLSSSTPESIADNLRQLRKLQRGQVLSWGRYLPESQTVEYTVGVYEDITPGLFHKLTGALSSAGLQILSADINTLIDGIALDRFVVHDPDFSGQPPASRLEQVQHKLEEALLNGGPPAFRRLWKSSQQQNQAALSRLPTVVKADNSFSDRYTIIDVFTADRMGLLYAVSRALFDMQLSVSLAKIGTHLDQVVDVFYVTDQDGNKIHDEARLQKIRDGLLAAINASDKL